jgi:hypothetical protein
MNTDNQSIDLIFQFNTRLFDVIGQFQHANNGGLLPVRRLFSEVDITISQTP